MEREWLRRHAQSSMPMTVGGGATGTPRRRNALSSVSLLTGSISRLARPAAGRPPSARPR